MKFILEPPFQGLFDVYIFNDAEALTVPDAHSPVLEKVTYPQFHDWFHDKPNCIATLPRDRNDLVWLCKAGQRTKHPAHSKSYCMATFSFPKYYRYFQEKETILDPVQPGTSPTGLFTLDITALSALDTDCGYRSHTAGLPAVWRQAGVAVPYRNAFAERIVAAFTVGLHVNDDTQQTVLDLAFSDGTTCLQFEVPRSWADPKNVPFAPYQGEFDLLPAAGLGGNFGEVRQHGTGVVVLTPALNKLAAAHHEEEAKNIEY